MNRTFQVLPVFCKKADSNQCWFLRPEMSVMLPSFT